MPLDPLALGMQPHPEGGWFRETWRHDMSLTTPRGERALATCIAFLLQAGQRSAWHRVASAELWLWQGGGPLRLSLGGFGASPVPGSRYVLHEGSQYLVRADEWQSAEVSGDEPALVACVVAPGFDYADFTMHAG